MARRKRENTKDVPSRQQNREEKANRHKKSCKNVEDDDICTLKTQLAQFGLALREVPGDGNCLFRALGDQLDGHMGNHLRHRKDTADFMLVNRKHFEPFVEDDVPFEKHITMLGEPGTYVGNDAIVAFASLHQVTVVIHQPNAPLWRVQGFQHDETKNERNTKPKQKSNLELHIAYHGGDHYDSVRKLGDTGHLPANIKLETRPPIMKEEKQQVALPAYDSSYLESAEEVTDLEKEAMDRSGCTDLFVVRQLLENNFYNLDATVEDLLCVNVTSNSYDKETNSEESQVPEAKTTSNIRKNKKPLPARKQERQKKIERKKRATEERNNNPTPDPEPIQAKFQYLSI